MAESAYVLLGVMSNPVKPLLRDQWREWAASFASHNRAVQVRYVLGKTIYQQNVDPGQSTIDLPVLQAELKPPALNDLLFVEGRERLPHVGVVTEKSAYFWKNAVTLHPSTSWFCKCDDDTLVHLDRLEATLRHVLSIAPCAETEAHAAQVEMTHPDKAVYFGHMKWRGWDVDHRFQACGGTWGDARKTEEDILQGVVTFRPVPAHYNDAYIIERSKPLNANDQ
ncbi:MAG: hypothetical protein SGPRY_007087, partial [Prymnesium sp.]